MGFRFRSRSLRFRLFEEHDIGVGVAADEAKFLAVERPVKVPNVFRFEVGDLLSRRTIEGLKPEIVYVLVADRIDDGFAILGEMDIATLRDRALQVYKFRILGRIDRHQCQLLVGDAGGSKRGKSRQLTVWRYVESVGDDGKVSELFSLPSVQGHPT